MYTIRFDFDNDLNCGGSSSAPQNGTAEWTLDLPEDAVITLSMGGRAEVGYEEFALSVDGTVMTTVRASRPQQPASTFRGWCADGVLDATGTTCCPAGCTLCGECSGCSGAFPCRHNNDGTCLPLVYCNNCCDESYPYGGCAPDDSYGLNCIGYVKGGGWPQMSCCTDGSTMDPGSGGDQCCTGQIQDSGATCATDADVGCVLPESLPPTPASSPSACHA